MKRKGFTLIELIVVIAILAVLALLLVPQITGYINETKTRTCETNRKQVERALSMIAAKDETVPTTLSDLANVDNAMYTGGKVCPEGNQNITITGMTVNCSKHGSTTGGGTNNPGGNQGDTSDGNTETSFCVANSKYCVSSGILDFMNFGNDQGQYNGRNVLPGEFYYYKDEYYFAVVDGSGDYFSSNKDDEARRKYLETTQQVVKLNLNTINQSTGNMEKDETLVSKLNPGDLFMKDGQMYVKTHVQTGKNGFQAYVKEIDISTIK